jgi:hypothetical protein
MAADDQRPELLRRAVTLTAELDVAAMDELFSADMTVWSAGVTASSHGEIAAELTARDEVFTDIKVDFGAVDVVGDRGYGEWVVAAVHSDALVLDGLGLLPAG